MVDDKGKIGFGLVGWDFGVGWVDWMCGVWNLGCDVGERKKVGSWNGEVGVGIREGEKEKVSIG